MARGSLPGETILHSDSCGVCGKPIHTVLDRDYPPDERGYHTAVKDVDENGNHVTMCDYGTRKSCFKSFHSKCFDWHECEAHPRKKIEETDLDSRIKS